MVAGRGNRRRYSDTDRAAALATLDATGGDVSEAARRSGVPRKTLEDWARGRVSSEVADLRQGRKSSLAARFKAIAHKMVGVADAKADALNAKDAMIAAGIATEKMLLLRGGRPAGGVTVVVVVQGANVGDL